MFGDPGNTLLPAGRRPASPIDHKKSTGRVSALLIRRARADTRAVFGLPRPGLGNLSSLTLGLPPGCVTSRRAARTALGRRLFIISLGAGARAAALASGRLCGRR